MTTPPPPAHLAHVQLHEYSEHVPRNHVENEDGTCGALPANAFQGRYPKGCLRMPHREGRHSAEPRSAVAADYRADRRKAMEES